MLHRHSPPHPLKLMPIDPTSPAASLISQQELSPAEKQNRYGIVRQVVSGLESGKHITILAVQTPRPIEPGPFSAINTYLKQYYGVEAMQAAFDCTVPDFGENYRNDLHLQAHLRAERKNFDEPITG